jgi:hypothetical protein
MCFGYTCDLILEIAPGQQYPTVVAEAEYEHEELPCKIKKTN